MPFLKTGVRSSMSFYKAMRIGMNFEDIDERCDEEDQIEHSPT
eukprot:CAMPEP_0170566780 /NCGR_PEP_ID=MMETSP0211-20121228/80055_1 /TAXON_ID=311385 /ORGANISM="Pseudokeronopsis sp., Strain OXSARD2" /LENGTH=42 /DNA_ID= /DNA_START= /DNA_END= /DNA_ORIENTATION=